MSMTPEQREAVRIGVARAVSNYCGHDPATTTIPGKSYPYCCTECNAMTAEILDALSGFVVLRRDDVTKDSMIAIDGEAVTRLVTRWEPITKEDTNDA